MNWNRFVYYSTVFGPCSLTSTFIFLFCSLRRFSHRVYSISKILEKRVYISQAILASYNSSVPSVLFDVKETRPAGVIYPIVRRSLFMCYPQRSSRTEQRAADTAAWILMSCAAAFHIRWTSSAFTPWKWSTHAQLVGQQRNTSTYKQKKQWNKKIHN